eukprot:comp23659_c0_seq1/m.40437 comp23659_c0_seq1/g.40437  ORF comp23659_c0_seq1/g.40437 comp23659_c0_seq1/m.40437 type:complete len:308 (+) comp23659_c0_seq1:179-1102(+)
MPQPRSHVDGGSPTHLLNIGLQCRFDFLRKESGHLLGGPAHECGGVQKLVQLVVDGSKVGIGLDPLNQIVLPALHLDHLCSLMRQHTDLLVALLAITTGLDHSHDDVLSSHKRQLLTDALLNHLGIDDQTLAHVLQGVEADVGSKEGLRQGNAPDGTVVKGALHPLHGRSLRGIGYKCHQVPGQTADALRAHGVALVGHSRRADLILLEGLLNLLEGRKQADVGGNLMHGGTQAAQHRQDVVVDLAAVGLPSDDVGTLKPGHLRHQTVKLLNLVMITVEQLQKRGLCACGALDTTEPHLPPDPLQMA